MDLKEMEIQPFSGFQVTRQARDDMRRLITESKWRKLQKHFSISVCFSCCRCELLIFDLESLYEHFSTVHQVNLSYIESLLKESEEGIKDSGTNFFIHSEDLIEELIQLNGTWKKCDTAPLNVNDQCLIKDEDMPDVSHTTASLVKKGGPKKRSSKPSPKKAKYEQKFNEKSEVTIAKRAGKGRKGGFNRRNTESKVKNDKLSSEDKGSPIHKTRSTLKTVTKTTEHPRKELSETNIKISNEKEDALTQKKSATKIHANNAEGTCTGDETIENIDEIPCDEEATGDLFAPEEKMVHVIAPLKDKPVRGTTVGRNVDSEEIKAKTCAICKDIMPTIKDCFKHYELVHDYVPKSVYEKPPVDTKFEKSKAKSEKRTKGRAKTDGNAEQCRFCGKMFLKDNIDKHIHLRHYWLRIERKEKRRQVVVCHLCGKLYHHKQNLEAHMASAHRGKPRKKPSKSCAPKVHICQTCGYTTPEIRRLNNHIAAHHEGVMPYKCDQCSFQTWEPSSWRCHKQRHSEDKKYKCTQCSYQCIQRKQLRRHMSVKHQTVLPKKWKRKDDSSPVSHTGSKLLPNTSELMTVKQRGNQLNCMNSQGEVGGGASQAVSLESLQFQVNNAQNNMQVVQLAPTVDVSNLNQSGLSLLSADGPVPTEIVITVANTSDYTSSNALTSVASSNVQTPMNRSKIPRTVSTVQHSRDSPVVIPQQTPGLKAVIEEPSVSTQELILVDHFMEVQPEQSADDQLDPPNRRYYKPHFPLLHDIIKHRPNGPVVKISKDGSMVFAPEGESGETVMYSLVPEQMTVDETGSNEEAQVLLLDSTSDNVVSVHTVTSEMSASTIDMKQASELTDYSAPGHSLKRTRNLSRNPPQMEPEDQEGVESLEQDIAQTLIRINPLSRLHNNPKDRIQK